MLKLSDKIPMQIEYDKYLKIDNVNIEKTQMYEENVRKIGNEAFKSFKYSHHYWHAMR